jgi:hypothetical protein
MLSPDSATSMLATNRSAAKVAASSLAMQMAQGKFTG